MSADNRVVCAVYSTGINLVYVEIDIIHIITRAIISQGKVSLVVGIKEQARRTDKVCAGLGGIEEKVNTVNAGSAATLRSPECHVVTVEVEVYGFIRATIVCTKAEGHRACFNVIVKLDR